MLWSIDSCGNRVAADKRHVTVLRAQVVQLIDVTYLLKFSADQLWYSRDRRLQKLYFKKTFRKSSLESFAFGFGLIYVLCTVGGVYSL